MAGRRVARGALRCAKHNLFAISLAAGVLHGHGIVFTPAAGAVLMSSSTVVVAINAQFLKRVEL